MNSASSSLGRKNANTAKFGGIIVPMITPFDEDGELAGENLREYISFLADSDVDGLFPCSSIGEMSSMTSEERKRVMEIVVDETRKEVSIFPGTGSNYTKRAIELTRYAEEVGADGAIVVTPYYLSIDQGGLIEHFGKIAGEVDVPLFIYHVPQYSGQRLETETVVHLQEEHENIVGLKDSSGNLDRLSKLIQMVSNEFVVMQGIPELLLSSLIIGCGGGIPSTANIDPGLHTSLYENFRSGEMYKAMELQKRINLLADLADIGIPPAGIKEVLRRMGIDEGHPRPPVRSLNREETERLKRKLEGIELSHG